MDRSKMKHSLLILTCLSSLLSCKKEGQAKLPDDKLKAVEVHDFASLEPMLQVEDDRLHLVNFWATWCKPCLEELPYFEQVRDSLGDEKVEVLLVSLDFKDKLESQLIPYLEKNGLGSRVVLLDDPHENEWIPRVDSAWSGAIPATLIYNSSQRAFYEMSFSKRALREEISKFLNN